MSAIATCQCNPAPLVRWIHLSRIPSLKCRCRLRVWFRATSLVGIADLYRHDAYVGLQRSPDAFGKRRKGAYKMERVSSEILRHIYSFFGERQGHLFPFSSAFPSLRISTTDLQQSGGTHHLAGPQIHYSPWRQRSGIMRPVEFPSTVGRRSDEID